MKNWPKEIKDQLDGRDPRVGDWYFFYCEQDLEQISNQERLDNLYDEVEELLDDGIAPGRFFEYEFQARETAKDA